MGTGSSHSVSLGSSARFASLRYPSPPPARYAHPHNRVLPAPAAGQRLRATDNGSILHSAGTIRGQQNRDGGGHLESSYYRNQRLFHSDPDIARTSSGYHGPEHTTSNSRRSCQGTAASKLKYKRKSQAPQPPRSSGSPSACRCPAKPKAPPPPPMPPKAEVVRRSYTPNGDARRTRAVSSYEKNVHPLEKWRNCTRSAGDVRMHEDEEEEDGRGSRTIVFDSKKISENPGRLPSYLPQGPDPFQREIQAVTRKIAESKGAKVAKEPIHLRSPPLQISSPVPKQTTSPPKFYFADTDVFKIKSPAGAKSLKPEGISKADSVGENIQVKITSVRTTTPPHNGNNTALMKTTLENRNPQTKYVPNSATNKNNVLGASNKIMYNTKDQSYRNNVTSTYFSSPSANKQLKSPSPVQKSTSQFLETGHKSPSHGYLKKDYIGDRFPHERIAIDEVVPSLERFSPIRRKVRSPSRDPRQKSESDWDHLSKSLYRNKENDADIDIRHRPVISRKLTEGQPFCASPAWRGMGSDGASSRSTSDDGVRASRNVSDSHWTPRQDLADDSDGSTDGEGAVIARSGFSDFSPRFSLPSIMFSNMRRIGSEHRYSDYSGFERRYPEFTGNSSRHYKKKGSRKESRGGYVPNFGGFLSKRSRFLSEDDLAVSDSNWTFGGPGLSYDKGGRKYSSEMILSDRGRRDLLLGDVLNSRTSAGRGRSSDSSNFSLCSTGRTYSTEIGYLRNGEGSRDRYSHEENGSRSPTATGRVQDIRRRFDNIDFSKRSSKKDSHTRKEIELGRRRELELAKMLEDEVRKRRNKEKISIRQQLQRMRGSHQYDEDEFDDEAYFTEPKSRESPFFAGSPVPRDGLTHWKSSPALLQDPPRGKLPAHKVATDEGNLSSSPTPKKEGKKKAHSVYKQLMEIVRQEEKHMKEAAAKRGEPSTSRDSSFSPRESSPSTCCSASSTDSSSVRSKVEEEEPRIVPNCLLQPYSSNNKGYRPIHYGISNERKPILAKVS